MSSVLPKSTLSLGEALVLSLLCFGLFIVWSFQAVVGGFPTVASMDSRNWTGILIEAVLAAVALSYLHARRFDLRLLAVHPDLRGTLQGVGLFVVAWFLGLLVVWPFALQPGAAAFSFHGASIFSTVLFAMVNGAFEEVFLLGALVKGLRRHELSIAIGLPLLVRLLYHTYQGPLGLLWILCFGVCFTLFYLREGRLWPVVFAHTLWDIVPAVLQGR